MDTVEQNLSEISRSIVTNATPTIDRRDLIRSSITAVVAVGAAVVPATASEAQTVMASVMAEVNGNPPVFHEMLTSIADDAVVVSMKAHGKDDPAGIGQVRSSNPEVIKFLRQIEALRQVTRFG